MPRGCPERSARSPLRIRRRWGARATTIAGLVIGSAFASPSAWATGRDFVDETQVAEGMRAGETGLELGSDARVDPTSPAGWFTGALERGFTSLAGRWRARLDRGSGLELAGWRAGTRCVLLEAITRRLPPPSPGMGGRNLRDQASALRARAGPADRPFPVRGSLLATANGGVAKQIWRPPSPGPRAPWPDRDGERRHRITREPLDVFDPARAAGCARPARRNTRPPGWSVGLRGPYRFIARIVFGRGSSCDRVPARLSPAWSC